MTCWILFIAVDFTYSTRYHETVSVSLPSLFILLCLQTRLVSQPENPENAWAVQESKRLVPFGSTTPFGLKPPLSFFHLDTKGFAKQISLMQRDDDLPQHPGHHQHPLTTIL
jgi:hypothetical protein